MHGVIILLLSERGKIGKKPYILKNIYSPLVFYVKSRHPYVCSLHILIAICQILEVCVPELGTKRDETGRDWRPFPNGRDRDGTTSLWSRSSGKFGKNSGKIRDGTGLLGTTREKS